MANDKPPTGGTRGDTDSVPFNPTSYVKDGSVEWGPFLSRLARGGIYGAGLTLVSIVVGGVEWVQEKLQVIASVPGQVGGADVVAEPLTTAYTTALANLPDGTFGFVVGVVVVVVVAIAADRAIALVGGP